MADNNYLDYIITDIQLHAQLPAKPKSAERAIKKSFLTGKPQRTYRHIKRNDAHIDTGTFDVDLLLEDELRRAQEYAVSQGKVLRVLIPKTGINVFIAPDGLEKIRAVERQKSRTL